MDLSWSDDEEAFRSEARSWLAAHVPEDLGSGDTRDGFARHLEWERRLFADRWAVVSWPEAYGGRDASIWEWLIFEEEYYRAGAPQRVTQNGIFLLAPTVFAFGTLDQQGHVLPRMAAAEDLWCQGWSEPNAGSDLAAVRSKATRVDGGWVLDGQKTWTTRGAFSTHLFGLFRTDPASERHRGLSYLMVPLDLDGITVRGFGRLDGDEGFAEVFFEDAFLPDDAIPGGPVLGAVDDGWRVAMATTGSERGLTLRSPGRFRATADRLVELWRATPPIRRSDSVARPPRRGVDARRGLRRLHAPDGDDPGRWWRGGRGVEPQQDLVERARRGAAPRRARPARSRVRGSRGPGPRGGSSRCPARSTPAPTRSSATSPPNGCSASRRIR